MWRDLWLMTIKSYWMIVQWNYSMGAKELVKKVFRETIEKQ